MTNCIVYQAVNLANGKRYLGATENGLRVRRRKHLANAKRGQSGKFYTAIRAYGAENFEFSILAECRDFWHALEEERRLIAELRPEYNLTEGGGGVKGLRFSEEAKQKMSISAKRRWGTLRTPEEEAAIKTDRASRLHRKGMKIADASVLAMRRGIVALMNAKRRRPVRCITDDLPFISATAAAAHYGISTASVVLYCQKKVKAKSGLIFEYEVAA